MFVKRTTLLLSSVFCCLAAGCSMCCGVYDYMYPTMGGKYERVDPEYGRVGSIYSDPMAGGGSPVLSNQDIPEEPSDRPQINLGDEEEAPTPPGPADEGSGNRETNRSDGRWR